MRIRGDRHPVIIGGQEKVKDVPFVLNPSATPKTTEDHLPDGRVIRGIYELTGDTLRSCVAAPNAPRPTEFTAKAGTGQTLRVFRRVKE